MNENLKMLISYALTIAGGWLIGHNISLFGQPVTTDTWQLIVGILMSIGTTVFSFMEKTITQESFLGALRHIFTTIGTILTSAGLMTAESLAAWLGLIMAGGPIIWSIIVKNLNVGLKTRQIDVHSLHGKIPATTSKRV
jgi:hypothetical protein